MAPSGRTNVYDVPVPIDTRRNSSIDFPSSSSSLRAPVAWSSISFFIGSPSGVFSMIPSKSALNDSLYPCPAMVALKTPASFMVLIISSRGLLSAVVKNWNPSFSNAALTSVEPKSNPACIIGRSWFMYKSVVQIYIFFYA